MRFDKPIAVFLFSLLFAYSCQTSKPIMEQEAEDEILEIPEPEPLEIKSSESPFIKALEHGIAAYRAKPTRTFDLLHTTLDLTFDYENEWVNGTAELTLVPYFYPQKELVLDAKDFEIHSFRLIGGEESDLNFRYNQQKITAYLPTTYSKSDTLKVRIRYTAKPNENAGGGSMAITDTKGLYFINADSSSNKPIQIWTQGETEHNSKWFPTIDAPNERMTQDIKLTVKEDYTTISNGVLHSKKSNGDGTRTDRWLMEQAHAPYLAAVVVGDFVEIKDDWEGVQVNYYVEKAYEEGAKKVFEKTPEMIGFFSDMLGVKYPWPKYDQVVVRDFVSGAMENTTISVFMEALNLDERGAIDSEWDGIIAHELFHQWFGNLVTTESWSNLTLNEAFANYSEYLWYEYKEGKDEADMHHITEMEQYFSEAKTKQVDLIRFYYQDAEDMFDSHSYAKGGRILHMLRRHLGDEAFFASLNHYLTKHAYSSVEVHDLRLAFEDITGRDLNWFFNQWFFESGHPILEYEVDYSQPENLLLTIAQRQDFENTPLYKLPVKVSWYHEGERFEKELILEREWQQFAIGNEVPVSHLYVDEAVELLAEKKSARGKNHFISQFGNSKLAVARYEALDSLGTSYGEDSEVIMLTGEALKDEFWAIREMALMHIGQQADLPIEIKDLESTVYDLADSDPKNTVRLAAIEVLAMIDGDKYASDFMRWMNDPSYYVAGAALGAYLENPANANREAIASRYEDETNIRLLVALADYYIAEGIAGKADWFHSNLESLTGQSIYYFVGYYGDYFVKMEEGSEKAIENLYTIGKTNQVNFVRIAAFMGLFGFIDQPGVLEKAKDLFDSETDEMTKRYQEYFLSAYEAEN